MSHGDKIERNIFNNVRIKGVEYIFNRHVIRGYYYHFRYSIAI